MSFILLVINAYVKTFFIEWNKIELLEFFESLVPKSFLPLILLFSSCSSFML